MKICKTSITLRLPIQMLTLVELQLVDLDMDNTSQFIREAIQEKLDRHSILSVVQDIEARNRVAIEQFVSSNEEQIKSNRQEKEGLTKVILSTENLLKQIVGLVTSK